jgi:hypothetical protein
LDLDNGSEFINAQLLTWWDNRISVRMSRLYNIDRYYPRGCGIRLALRNAAPVGGSHVADRLSAEQIDQFVELGFCTLPGAFTPHCAAAACDLVWARMAQNAGIHRDDPRTWPAFYNGEKHIDAPAVRACVTEALAEAIETLLGPGRWRGIRNCNWNFWPVNFSFGADESDAFPCEGWHIDGEWFSWPPTPGWHSLDAMQQGPLAFGLFTDLAPGGGGTALALGSHKTTARLLARYPQGHADCNLFDEVLREPIGNFHEITGEAGDVVLAHPLLLHARGYKRSGPPRIISITDAELGAPISLHRADGDYSILEESIRRALRSAPDAPRQAKLCRPVT